jgi:hypothetical protein
MNFSKQHFILFIWLYYLLEAVTNIATYNYYEK